MYVYKYFFWSKLDIIIIINKTNIIILYIFFFLVDKEICIGNLQIQICRDVTQGSYMTNIYEATCLSVFSLVCQISNSEFSELVMLLLKYLLSGGLFSSLLSSDVWSFVCRYFYKIHRIIIHLVTKFFPFRKSYFY